LYFLECHVPTEAASGSIGRGRTTSRRLGGIALPLRALLAVDTLASCTCRRVVVVIASRLHDFQGERIGKIARNLDELGGNDRANNQTEEYDEDDKVQNGVADNTTLAKLCLLERINRRTDLTTEPC
jgi:hypothetical protein